MRLRYRAQHQVIARLLLLGFTAEGIAKRLGNCTPRSVRYAIARPEFEELFATMQRDYFKRLDQKMNRLLYGAVVALRRQLKSHDWRARASAIEQVFKIHGRYVEKIDHTGHVSHAHQHQLAMDELTDEQRTWARLLLASKSRARGHHGCSRQRVAAKHRPGAAMGSPARGAYAALHRPAHAGCAQGGDAAW
jgi:hypothetical protein